MIRKLKRKFILLATVSVFVLVTLLVAVMNLINYSVVVKDSDATVDILLSADTSPDGKDPHPDPSPAGGRGDGGPAPGMSPEVPYESRFFSVIVLPGGEIGESDFSKILSVDSASAGAYAQAAMESGDLRGFVGQFRYGKVTTDAGTRILFLDCGRKLDAFLAFLRTSVCVGLAGCVAVFVVFLLLSGKIVQPIAESYEKQRRFISDAGHEMKTPLTIIGANLDLLEGEVRREELDDIRQQTNRLTELTGGLVYLSKMEEGGSALQMVELPLSDTVAEASAAFRAPVTAKKIAFTVNITPAVTATGSPDAIRRLVSLLLENAVKYTPEGGEIAVGLAKSKKTAELTVYNTSVYEINRADLARVFDRFYRTDASRNPATGGHGIGLSVAKAIAEAHGGSIAASTKTGKDFLVTVTIPL